MLSFLQDFSKRTEILHLFTYGERKLMQNYYELLDIKSNLTLIIGVEELHWGLLV